MASAVVAASALRHCGKISGRARKSQMNTPTVTTKWAMP